MGTKKSLCLYGCLCLSIVAACSGEKTEDESLSYDLPADSLEVTDADAVLSLMEESNEFPDAIVEMYAPLGNQTFNPGKIPFEFNIKNYPIKEESSQPRLYMITNGADPIGYQSTIFQLDLKEGTYRTVAYLVDSQGLCLKEFGNYVDRDFLVGNSRPFPYSGEPYLALNLPQNGQEIAHGEDVIVDFLVIGGDMLMDGMKVLVEVANRQFETEDVVPVKISNLPVGEHLVRVELRKKDGSLLDGPFSSVQKTILIH